MKGKIFMKLRAPSIPLITIDPYFSVWSRDEIINLDINTLTPVEALMKLNEIKKMVTRK